MTIARAPNCSCVRCLQIASMDLWARSPEPPKVIPTVLTGALMAAMPTTAARTLIENLQAMDEHALRGLLTVARHHINEAAGVPCSETDMTNAARKARPDRHPLLHVVAAGAGGSLGVVRNDARRVDGSDPEERKLLISEYPNGLHLGIPDEIYHQRILGMASKSTLDELGRSPLHYKSYIDGATIDEDSEALTFGRAFHCALLEPERFAAMYAVEPEFGDCRMKEPKARRDAWRAQNAGAIHLSNADATAIMGMLRAVKAHPLASRMIADGEAEVTALWNDEETGVRCRVRTDYYVRARGMLVDVKSTRDASLDAFKRDIFKFGYHRQSALYRMGFDAIGETAQHFIFIAVEKTPPYAVGVYTLDEQGIVVAHARLRSLLATMRDCLKTDEWPGYDAGIQTIETPNWVTQ